MTFRKFGRVFTSIFLVWTFFATSTPVLAESLTILVNANNPVMTISDQELADYFLKVRSSWPESRRVHPVFLEEPANAAFKRVALQKDEWSWNDYWKKRQAEGVLPPLVLTDLRKLLNFVSFDEGAIAFVQSSALKGQKLQNIRAVRTVE